MKLVMHFSWLHLRAGGDATHCISMGYKPILPPDLKVKRLLILLQCDDEILNQREGIKSEIKKQNDCIKVQDIFKYNSPKNIKATFESQHTALQVLTKGLLSFNLSHPAHNICKENFV